MALFFNTQWFDARLASAHLTRNDVARALGLSESEIAEVWKDQRALSARDVSTLAALLAATPQEIAQHAGISTPVPGANAVSFAELSARLERVEIELAQMKALLERRP
ncbi:MAG: helix-turn-helix transcriptional regulator [Proteobacteria bacterium]|nr:helix-turn-helix transcriptional regulator [Pseudomonadota bacterium]